MPTITTLPNHGFIGKGYVMGGEVDPPSTFEILYHRLQITVGTRAFSYVVGSGIYREYSQVNNCISAIQSSIQHGTTLPQHYPLYNQAADLAPDIVIKNACYVVIDILSDDQPTLCFQTDVAPLRTADDHSGDYGGLTYFGDGTRPTTVYFEAFSPRPEGDDSYNFYLQYGDDTAPQKWIVDPKIKNRGIRKRK